LAEACFPTRETAKGDGRRGRELTLFFRGSKLANSEQHFSESE
jgi:hypothetical protein